MTIQEKYTALISELYRSFDFFNQKFAEGKLYTPVITTQGDKRKNSTNGWFGKNFWAELIKDENGEVENELQVHEINLTAEALVREPNDVLETLLHEMAHQWNAQEDINDCSATQHHNKHFKRTAEKFGLIVEKTERRGWSKTSLDIAGLKAIEELQPKVELYKIFRKPPEKLKSTPKIINLPIGLDYEQKIELLMDDGGYEKKREFTESIIDKLYDEFIDKDKITVEVNINTGEVIED